MFRFKAHQLGFTTSAYMGQHFTICANELASIENYRLKLLIKIIDSIMSTIEQRYNLFICSSNFMDAISD